jgi:hypothetical protein
MNFKVISLHCRLLQQADKFNKKCGFSQIEPAKGLSERAIKYLLATILIGTWQAIHRQLIPSTYPLHCMLN